MKGYNVVPTRSGLIRVNKTQEEEALIHQLRKVKTMGDQGFVTKGLMYSERKDGVLPEFDIRTDKWEVAQNAANVASKNEIAKRGGAPEFGKKEAGEQKQGAEPAASESGQGTA